MKFVNKKAPSGNFSIRNNELWISFILLALFIASFVEVLTWAFTFMVLEAIPGLEEVLYFSIDTFTTLWYGDVTLSDTFRLLASVEAANGIIIFGWSTAITMAVEQKFYFKSKNT